MTTLEEAIPYLTTIAISSLAGFMFGVILSFRKVLQIIEQVKQEEENLR